MIPITFRPILAAAKPRDYTDQMFYDRIKFPVLATPKLDGIRCLTRDLPRPPEYQSEALCRSLKPVPNEWIRYQIGTKCPPGLDGEIITYNTDLFQGQTVRNFNLLSSDVMAYSGQPTFKYHVFDSNIEAKLPYCKRLDLLRQLLLSLPDFCQYVQETECHTIDQLLAYEDECVTRGLEGICFRDPYSKYKYGRSTLREGHLVKMKRFVTEEAMIIGVEEEMANNNPITQSETGYAERSSHGANMVGKNRLGALVCRLKIDLDTIHDRLFKVGTGFTAQQRQEYWDTRDALIGRTITFKHQPHGAHELPRIPVFIGFRDKIDL